MTADLTKDVIYRLFKLNDSDVENNITPGNGIGSGITGCVLDSLDINDVDIVQFMEKRSLEDGMDVGQVFKGARRVRMTGTIYGTTRASLYDQLQNLRAAMDPVLAQADEPADFGYQPLYFSRPTLNLDPTTGWSTGYINLRVLAMPRSIQGTIMRDVIGGSEDDSLGLPWQAAMICRDPRIMSQTEQDYSFTNIALTTGGTIAAVGDLVTKTAHGLVAGDRIRFATLTGGTGLSTSTTYYVLASGLTSSAFKVSLTSGGAAVDITVNYTTATWTKVTTQTGTLVNRGDHYGVLNALFVVGAGAGTIVVQAGTSTFTVTLPASSASRTIRIKGDDKIITVDDGTTEVTDMSYISFAGSNTWPQVAPGSTGYSLTFTGIELQTGSHMWFWESFA